MRKFAYYLSIFALFGLLFSVKSYGQTCTPNCDPFSESCEYVSAVYEKPGSTSLIFQGYTCVFFGTGCSTTEDRSCATSSCGPGWVCTTVSGESACVRVTDCCTEFNQTGCNVLECCDPENYVCSSLDKCVAKTCIWTGDTTCYTNFDCCDEPNAVCNGGTCCISTSSSGCSVASDCCDGSVDCISGVCQTPPEESEPTRNTSIYLIPCPNGDADCLSIEKCSPVEGDIILPNGDEVGFPGEYCVPGRIMYGDYIPSNYYYGCTDEVRDITCNSTVCPAGSVCVVADVQFGMPSGFPLTDEFYGCAQFVGACCIAEGEGGCNGMPCCGGVNCTDAHQCLDCVDPNLPAVRSCTDVGCCVVVGQEYVCLDPMTKEPPVGTEFGQCFEKDISFCRVDGTDLLANGMSCDNTEDPTGYCASGRCVWGTCEPKGENDSCQSDCQCDTNNLYTCMVYPPPGYPGSSLKCVLPQACSWTHETCDEALANCCSADDECIWTGEFDIDDPIFRCEPKELCWALVGHECGPGSVSPEIPCCTGMTCNASGKCGLIMSVGCSGECGEIGGANDGGGGRCVPGFNCISNLCVWDPICILEALPYEGPQLERLDSILALVFRILYLVGLGVGLFTIILAGYKFMTSQGDPYKVKEAQESLTSAIIGILFIIASIAILRIVLGKLLNFPIGF